MFRTIGVRGELVNSTVLANDFAGNERRRKGHYFEQNLNVIKTDLVH